MRVPLVVSLVMLAVDVCALASSGCSAASATTGGGAPDASLEGDPSPDPDGGIPDGAIDGAPPAPVTITLRTFAFPSMTSTGAPMSATWAAYLADDGAWTPLTASSAGVYTFTTTRGRWQAAVACADGVMSSRVSRFVEPASAASLSLVLSPYCSPAAPASVTLSGALTNVPSTTSWLDFGYALDSRGAIQPVNGTTASYQLVNVDTGTWDLAFGLRDDSTSALTRVMLARGVALTTDTTLNLDANGATAGAAGTHALVLHGLSTVETLTPAMYFQPGGGPAFGGSSPTPGPFGMDVSPPNVPSTTPDMTLAYGAVPAAIAAASDAYTGDIAATNALAGTARGARLSFHAPADVTFTMPAAPASAPTVTSAATTPFVRLSAQGALTAGAASYEVLAVATPSGTSSREWLTTIDASLLAADGAANVSDTTPDLSAVAGFLTAWGLPSGTVATVSLTARFPAAPLSDGTLTPYAVAQTTFTP